MSKLSHFTTEQTLFTLKITIHSLYRLLSTTHSMIILYTAPQLKQMFCSNIYGLFRQTVAVNKRNISGRRADIHCVHLLNITFTKQTQFHICMYLTLWYLFCLLDHLLSKVIFMPPHKDSKCFLEQIKIFQCGQSQLCAKSLIGQRHQAAQRDKVGLSWVILSLSKVLEEQVALLDTQELGIEDLWEDISDSQVILLNIHSDNYLVKKNRSQSTCGNLVIRWCGTFMVLWRKSNICVSFLLLAVSTFGTAITMCWISFFLKPSSISHTCGTHLQKVFKHNT